MLVLVVEHVLHVLQVRLNDYNQVQKNEHRLKKKSLVPFAIVVVVEHTSVAVGSMVQVPGHSQDRDHSQDHNRDRAHNLDLGCTLGHTPSEAVGHNTAAAAAAARTAVFGLPLPLAVVFFDPPSPAALPGAPPHSPPSSQ